LDQIRFNHKPDGFAIAEVAGIHFNPLVDISICRVRDDVRLGGVVYTNFTTESIQVHSACWTPHWLNRDMLYVTVDYPFNQLGVNRIFGMVPEDNLHAQEFNIKFGFQYVVRIEGVYKGNIPCMVMSLERGACRYLSVKPRSIRPNYH
jgi:RimJ/RimL family protein N-acetyltransferase